MQRRQAMRVDEGQRTLLLEGRPAKARRLSFAGRHSGQALIETLIFAMAAVTLLFGVLLIGRLHALQASATGAARALAFECRLDSAGCDDPASADRLAATLRLRHFGWLDGDSANPVTSLPPLGQSNRPHPFWTNPDGSRMVESLESISLVSARRSLDAGVKVAASTLAGFDVSGLPALANGPQRFGLDPVAGLRASQIEVPVHVSLSALPPSNGGGPLALRLKARLAVLGDEWNASQSSGTEENSVAARVERGSRLDPFREAALDAGYMLTRGMLRVADSVGFEPGGSALSSPRLDVTVIPQDRRQ